MHGMIVARPRGGRLPLDVGAVVAAARRRWGAAVQVRRDPPGLHSVLTLEVEPVGETFFHVDVMDDLGSVNLDGTPEQNLATAAWLRSLMPAEAARMIVFDVAWTMHAELRHGCTAQSLRAALVDHAVPGWDADEPDLR